MHARQAIYGWSTPPSQDGGSHPGEARLTLLKICKPSWPPDTYILPSKTVTPAALRFELIGVTTVHLQKQENSRAMRSVALTFQGSLARKGRLFLSSYVWVVSHLLTSALQITVPAAMPLPQVSDSQPVSMACEISTLRQPGAHLRMLCISWSC